MTLEYIDDGQVEWRIYYDGGLTYTNLDGPVQDAPKTGVQCIVVRDEEVGRRVERTEDYYIWEPRCGGWRGANEARMNEYLFMPGFKIVLFGRTLTDAEYREVLNRATSDPDMPVKSAWRATERR